MRTTDAMCQADGEENRSGKASNGGEPQQLVQKDQGMELYKDR